MVWREPMSEKSYDAVVIGGGPIGGFTAGLIAKAGFSTAIIEEHDTIGEPVQCAGLISPRCLEIVKIPGNPVINKLSVAEIFSPSGTQLNIRSTQIQAVVIDRSDFDRRIIGAAQDNGAVLIQGERAKSIRLGDKVRVDLGARSITAKLVIGADGARSAVRESMKLEGPAVLLNGLTAEISGLEIDQDRAKVFFGREVAPNFFAWIIPAGDIARVGLCVLGGGKTAYERFKDLFDKGPISTILSGGRIERYHSGLIPLGPLDRTFGSNAMLVGDAAGQVKATSGGGIYPGLVCARHCAATAVRALGEGDCSERSLASYHRNWRAEIGDELDKAMMMQRVFSSLDDSQLEDIFRMMSNPEIIETINRTGDIDFPSKLGWMLLRKEPGFLKYTGKFLKHGLLHL
jgi:geranylgeranyl reductase family protein